MPDPETTSGLARRDARTAGLILLAGLAAIALGITGEVEVLDTTSAWWHVVPLVVGCVAVAVQARWPRTMLVVGLACLLVDGVRAWSLGTVLVAWEVLYTAAMRFPWSWVHLLRRGVIAVAVAVTLTVAVVAQDVRTVANTGLLAFAVLGTPLWWGVDVRRQADLARLVEENAAHDRERAVKAERARMARDLHDAVAGDLASVALHAEAGLRRMPEDHPAQESLTTIRRSAVRAMGELRTMIDLLRRDSGDDVVSGPGLEALDELVAHAKASGLKVTVDRYTPQPLPLAVDHAAYRILQECLTNAARHGGAGSVTLRLHATEQLEIELVSGGGVGQQTSGGGLGLLTMRERAEGLGGGFESGRVDGQWRVRAWIPLAS